MDPRRKIKEMRNRTTGSMNIPLATVTSSEDSLSKRHEWMTQVGIFMLAFLLRLIYLLQISHAPFFNHPFGDAQLYHQRAIEILHGDFMGREVFFHSSPPYPYFMALFLALTHASSLWSIYLIQILIGSGNCLLIYALTKRLSQRQATPVLAALMAAFYGLFVFFDGDIMMISLTLFLIDLSLLLLVKYQEQRRPLHLFWAGAALGGVVLDKVNVLLFLPVLLFYLAVGFTRRSAGWQWKPVLLCLTGLSLVIVPVTVRNYMVGRDLVLVSSNGGVNFFIGNNPAAAGYFRLPTGSGLEDPNLYESSLREAEKALGRTLKPSEASRYWFRRGLDFYGEHPWAALKLLGKKMYLLLNAYEIPNHMSFDFVRLNFGTALQWMPIGYWLVFPLAMVGLARLIRKDLNQAGTLYLAFIFSYLFSMLLFFITERYRLPLVPLFIVFAAWGVEDMAEAVKDRRWKKLIICCVMLGCLVAFTLLPPPVFHPIPDRCAVASVYQQEAKENTAEKSRLLRDAIIQYKWALEYDPMLFFIHYKLALAYKEAGFSSAAYAEITRVLDLQPSWPPAIDFLKETQLNPDSEQGTGRKGGDAIPLTPCEEAASWVEKGDISKALGIYQKIIARDPTHFETLNGFGFIYFRQGQYRQAEKFFLKGLRINPVSVVLLNNLAETSLRLGKIKEAREAWNKCLKLEPDNKMILMELNRMNQPSR